MTTANPKQYDPVGDYLKGRLCPSHIVKAGFKGLVQAWEKVVAELVFDGYRYGLPDYCNDLDRRDLLEGAIHFLNGEVPEPFRKRIAVADQRFRDATHEADRCLLDGDAQAARAAARPLEAAPEDAPGHAVKREREWWYFRVPRRHRQNFAKDLEAAGIVVVP